MVAEFCLFCTFIPLEPPLGCVASALYILYTFHVYRWNKIRYVNRWLFHFDRGMPDWSGVRLPTEWEQQGVSFECLASSMHFGGAEALSEVGSSHLTWAQELILMQKKIYIIGWVGFWERQQILWSEILDSMLLLKRWPYIWKGEKCGRYVKE